MSKIWICILFGISSISTISEEDSIGSLISKDFLTTEGNNTTELENGTTFGSYTSTTVIISTTERPGKCRVPPDILLKDDCDWFDTNGAYVEINTDLLNDEILMKLANRLVYLSKVKLIISGFLSSGTNVNKIYDKRNLTGILFSKLSQIEDAEIVIENGRNLDFNLLFPTYENISIRNFSLTIHGNEQIVNLSNRAELMERICDTAICDIQEKEECMFLNSIQNINEYKKCEIVYGDMVFDQEFQDFIPRHMNFVLYGCFIVDQANIRILMHFSFVETHCTTAHEFTLNNLLCREDRIMTVKHFRQGIVEVRIAEEEAECSKGECFGNLVIERETQYFLTCEKVKKSLVINEKSGNLSDRIPDFAFIRLIEGTFKITNNPSIEVLILPLLKKIEGDKCPALTIENMPNLKKIIFHPSFSVSCNADSNAPAISISNCSKLVLPNDIYDWDKNERVEIGTTQVAPPSPFHFIQYAIYAAFGIMIIIEIILFIYNKNKDPERIEDIDDLLEYTNKG